MVVGWHPVRYGMLPVGSCSLLSPRPYANGPGQKPGVFFFESFHQDGETSIPDA